ncbi:glycosyltransferase family 2 protein [Actinoplanes sp. NBRC 103695]|uniref:glycosyltransferase family 2 protein n=1 Tax=Actinoplanes sp. NBRC 103695 TaxID=3032202 RepID=UPI0024A11709|nr:glycosyltransferase family 2 protein [Actinoplanes sp. NBRC 103695]GLZ01164.1 hypothetical protein Acsp02_84150 [Actinoplanes sp. NBRC 103695]
MTSVSVVMPTYGKNEYLEYTLASLVRQTHQDFELILVNDGGDPSTRDLVAAYRRHFGITYLTPPHGGRAAARNHGLQAADGDRVLFVDDCCIATPDLVRRHAGHDPGTLAIGWKRRVATVWKGGGRLTADDAERALLHDRFPEWSSGGSADQRLIEPSDLIEDFTSTAARIDLSHDYDNHPDIVHMFSPELRGYALPWTLVTTGNLSVSPEALADIGGFDETYRGWGIEDTDLGYRLHRHGLRTVFDVDAVNLHQLHPQGDGAVEFAVRRRGAELLRNAEHFCRNHGTLETYLYWQFVTRKHGLLQINQLFHEISAVESPTVRDEILRLYASALPPSPSDVVAPPNLYCAAAPLPTG